MRATVGNGWRIVHLSDRVCDLAKDSYEYRRFVGRDGFVRIRGEPGLDRATLLDRAIERAVASDHALLQRVIAGLIPSASAYSRYKADVRNVAAVMTTGEEAELIGVKRV